MQPFHHQSLRFLSVGALNTLHGYAWIFAIQFLTGQPFLANILGYSLAAVLGYFAHSRLTFGHQPSWSKAGRYSLVVGVCYLLNLLILAVLLRHLPAILAQFIAVSSFVILNYFGQLQFVFVGGKR